MSHRPALFNKAVVLGHRDVNYINHIKQYYWFFFDIYQRKSIDTHGFSGGDLLSRLPVRSRGFGASVSVSHYRKPFVLRPGYILLWIAYRVFLNARAGLFFRSHRRLTNWVRLRSKPQNNKLMVPIEMLGPRSFGGAFVGNGFNNFNDYRFFSKRLNSITFSGQNSFIRAPSSGAYN